MTASSSSQYNLPLLDGDTERMYPKTKQGPVLYRHALECIFAFASLADLARLSSVHRDWTSAVLSMARRRAKFILPATLSLLEVSGRTLARHITEIGEVRTSSDSTVMSYLDCASVSLVSRAMSHLQRLSVSLVVPLEAAAAADVRIKFPRSLTDLSLSLPHCLVDHSSPDKPMLPGFRAALMDIFFRFAQCDNESAPRILRPSSSADASYYPLKTMSLHNMATYILSCGAGEAAANEERLVVIFKR